MPAPVEEIKFGDLSMTLPRDINAIALARELLDLFEDSIVSEWTCKVCGCTQNNPCPGGCSWAAPNLCSRCTGKIENPAVPVIAPSSGPEEKFIQTGEIQKLPTAKEILIGNFLFDKTQEKSFRTLFFVEMDDGRVVLSYMQSRCYTTKENVLKLPYPVPNGYLKLIKIPNKITALRMYREYLAYREPEEKIPKPEPVKKLFTEVKNKVVLNGFAEVPRFDYSQVTKQTLGKSVFWESNGCLAIKKEGGADIVFAARAQIEVLKKLDKEALKEHIKNLNVPKQYVLREFIENLKDDAAGILPKVNPDTRGSHGDDFEKIGGI